VGKSNGADQTDTFGNFGAFMSRNFGSMLFVLILDRLVLCTIKFQEATFVNLYGIQVVHLSLSLPVISKVYILVKIYLAAIGDRVDVPLMRSAGI
jgi:hypothetical protein